VNNPLRYTDPTGYDCAEPDWQIRQRAANNPPRAANNTPPSDPFKGHPEYKKFYDFLKASGGSAHGVTMQDKVPSNEEIVDANAPKMENVTTIHLSDSLGGKCLTTLEGASLVNLGVSLPGAPENTGQDPSVDTVAQSGETKRNFTETKDAVQRTSGAGTSIRTTQTQGTEKMTPAVIQQPSGTAAMNSSASAAQGMAAVAVGGNHAMQVSTVSVGLVYDRSYVFGVPIDTAKGELLISNKSDLTKIQQNASDNGLPPLKVEDNTISLEKEDK
jgi:hypothetical protein